MMTGTMIPNRSASRPIRMLASPNPIIVSVYGSDASARATPNSACTAGSATTTDHMPTPPMVESARLTARRIQAWEDSTSPFDFRTFSIISGAALPSRKRRLAEQRRHRNLCNVRIVRNSVENGRDQLLEYASQAAGAGLV